MTSPRNRAGIDAEGLRPDAMGWDAGFVWFFTDRERAEESARSDCWGGERRQHDVWELDLAGLPVQPDPHAGWGDERDACAMAVAQSVPRERLRRLP